MKRITTIAALGLALLSGPAFAQFGSGVVFDPTQSAHAIAQINQFEQQIQQAEQLYTTAVETRNTIVSAYNLAHQLSTAPQLLYQHYVTPWTNWNTVVAVNTYGNTPAVLQAINSGINSVQGLEGVMLGQPPRYPLYASLNAQSQQLVAAQGATSDLTTGILQANLQTLGNMRMNSQQRTADIQKLEAATYTTDPNQQTYMATFQRMNEALLMQLHSQQDANQVAQAVALQQLVQQKQQQDALNAALQDAASYQQNYSTVITPLTSNYGSTMSQSH